MVDGIIVVSATDSDEQFAFKSEKGFFRWMKNTEHAFAENVETEKQDRSTITGAAPGKAGNIKTVKYECQLFSAKDPVDSMPK